MLLTRDQMLKVDRRRYKTLAVDELGGEVRIASLSAGASLKLKALAKEAKDGDIDERAMAGVMFEGCIVDEKGNPLLDPAAVGEFIDRISVETLKLLITEISSLSAPLKQANGAEVAEQNPSSAARSDASPSA